MLLQAPSGGAARRVTHPAVVHRGRPVRQATLTAAFKGGGPINPTIPSKYKAKPKGRPSTAPSLRLPSIGKPGKGGGVATPVLSSSAAPGPGNPRVTLPPPAATSVYANPFRGIAGLVPQRIDQGVDYSAPAGSAIHAIGPGKIIDASTASGWPGGGFIAEQLTAGPAKGHVWYTAEDVTPNVKAGQVVTPKTVIGKFAPGGSIETGWGTEGANVGNAIASGPAYGQPTEAAQGGGDPGAVATGWGQAASRLLHSLGAPAGILNQPKSGGAPSWASAPGGKYVPSKATSSPLPPAIPVSFTSPLPASGSAGGTAAHAAAVSRKPSGPPAKIKTPASPATSSTGISSTGLGSGPPVTTTGTGTPGTTTTVTTTTVPGNVPISSTGPFPSPYTTLWGTTGTTSGTSTVLLVGGAALLVLFLVMDARKGKSGGGSGLPTTR